jgi:methyl-accepting chemotaxis protein
MLSFYDLKITSKLALLSGCLMALMVAVGAVSVANMRSINRATSDLAENWLPSVRSVLTIKTDVLELRRWELGMLIFTTGPMHETMLSRAKQAIATLQADTGAYQALVASPEENAVFGQVQGLLKDYLAIHARYVALAVQGPAQAEQAKTVISVESAQLLIKLTEQMERLIKLNTDGAARSSADAATTYAVSLNWTVGLIAAGILIGLLCAMWIARLIARPLQAAVKIAQRVADGDLTATIRAETKDETGQMMQALHDMNASLLRIVGQVRASSDEICRACDEIATGNLDLSARTEQQASSLEETASSMEQLTSTVKHNAHNARNASALASAASAIAAKGGDIVGEAVSTMTAISESSRRIVDIIAVIDGIAFQTNILALNAAVEAARAGEQGRGFAVVASEVRNLAQRSAVAAKEIKALIDSSVSQVDTGHGLVGQVGASMKEIIQSIGRVNHIMAEISTASDEQTQGIEQVNDAVTQMDSVTQQNAALVEQASAAACSLQQQASDLNKAVQVFKIATPSAHNSPRSPAAAFIKGLIGASPRSGA